MHGTLWDLTVSSSPWGSILLQKQVTRLEALAIWFRALEEP